MAQQHHKQFLSTLGNNIKALRHQKTLSQAELASRCGMQKASLSRIESGKLNVRLLTLMKISEALEIPLTSVVRINTKKAID